MKRLLHISAGLLLVLAANAFAAGNTTSGKNVYGSCVACHGAQGEGNLGLNAPALAGQQEAYLVRQLNNFRTGVRGADAADSGGAQMAAMAAVLADDAAVGDVAAFLAALPVASSAERGEGDNAGIDLRNGENQYNGACGACHGAQAQGNKNLSAPRLAGLDGAYLKKQYQNFGSGVRGSHPDDRLGQQMKMMATMLATEKDLDDVIAFIGSN